MYQANIEATMYFDPSEPVVTSAEKLVIAVNDMLRTAEEVSVSFHGLRGVSSSYFNVLLKTIVEIHGIETLDNRVKFAFETQAQEMIFERSLKSVKDSLMVA